MNIEKNYWLLYRCLEEKNYGYMWEMWMYMGRIKGEIKLKRKRVGGKEEVIWV